MTEHLAILWEADRLTAVEAREGRDGVQLLRSVVVERPGTADMPGTLPEWGERLRERLTAAGISTKRTLVCVSRELVVTRLLEVPDVPDWELPDLVRFQTATKAGIPTDALTLDYLPLPKTSEGAGRRVLAFTIDAARLIECKSLLGPAGLEWVSLSVTALSATEGVARVLGRLSDPVLIVHQRDVRIELTILDNGHVIFSHATRLATSHDPRPLTAELTRATIALGQMHHGIELGRVIYCAERVTGEPGVRTFLEQRYGNRLQVIVPATDLSGSVRGWAEVPEPPMAVLGLLLSQIQPLTLGIDFLKPRRPQAPRQLKIPRWAQVSIAAALLAAGTTWWNWSTLSGLEQEIAELRTRSSEVQQVLDRGKANTAADEFLREWERSDISPTQTWSQFISQLPDTDRLYLSRVDWTPGTKETLVRFQGDIAARSREDIAELGHTLTANGFPQQPKAIGTNPRDPDYPFAMVLDMTIPRAGTSQSDPQKKP